MDVVFSAGAILMLVFGIVTIARAVSLGRQQEQSPAVFVATGLMCIGWACYTLFQIWFVIS